MNKRKELGLQDARYPNNLPELVKEMWKLGCSIDEEYLKKEWGLLQPYLDYIHRCLDNKPIINTSKGYYW